ncbi:MAG: N-acetyl-gamma-glutamyl-phosphate reductase [Chlorobi bacterium]|nr:N-acetyl-gamma-glutamyl-phosphate reductase [Chlorobiota bacterium]
MIRVGVIGASGFVGIELLRILAFHPHVEIAYAVSRSRAGASLTQIAPDLAGVCQIKLVATPAGDADVVFLAVPHSAAQPILAEFPHLLDSIVIDLSSDHRADSAFVYGSPELNRDLIGAARRIANPGCFATALLLSLLPLAKNGELPATIDASGITGSTGAGAEMSPTLHFSWRFANAQPYSILCHRHVTEVTTALAISARLRFVPYRGSFTRGIVTTCVFDTALKEHELDQLYRDYYTPHPMVRISDRIPDLKYVVGTARAVLNTTVVSGSAAIVCTLDNLLKGAAAQAVQNMNLALGFNECDGLPLRAIGW